MEKLSFEKFEQKALLNNQLRSVTGGGNATTWTGTGGTSGTDTANPGPNGTTFSDGSTPSTDPNTSK